MSFKLQSVKNSAPFDDCNIIKKGKKPYISRKIKYFLNQPAEILKGFGRNFGFFLIYVLLVMFEETKTEKNEGETNKRFIFQDHW